MLRLLTVCGLLTIALSLEVDFDFGGNDESAIESQLREQGFSEEDIKLMLQEDRDDREEMDNEEEEEYFSWELARGYDDCEEFKWSRRKDSERKQDWEKKDWKEEDWADNNKDWADNAVVDDDDLKDDDNEVDQYKSYKGYRKGYRGKHGYGLDGKKKKGNCPAKPKPLSEICAEIECAPFEKLNISGCGFEARRVLSANWTVTTIDTSDMRRGYQEAFWRLFKYIQGANDRGAKIAMTAPVINRWFLDENFQIEGAQMAFYISSAFQANPPTPTDDKVFVEPWDDAITYDRAFGGNRDDPEYYKKQFTMLWKGLAKEKITPYPKMSITAGYTRPGWGRQRKEVMLVDNGSM